MPTAILKDLSEGFAGDAFQDRPQCPICTNSSVVLHKAPNINPVLNHEFDFRICSECHHGWIDPMPTQGLLSYLYGKASPSVIGVWGESRLTLPERWCAKQELKGNKGRYFELGVGMGHLYQLFLAAGWECSGVDPGDWSGKFADVRRDLSEVPPNLNADLIVAFDVLEHVADPVSILRQLRSLASPEARLYCATPNRESFRAKHHLKNWRMLRPLGHVNYYSKQSITLALKSAGFEVRSLWATDLYEKRFPRRLHDLRAWLIELSGAGDQWVAEAGAC